MEESNQAASDETRSDEASSSDLKTTGETRTPDGAMNGTRALVMYDSPSDDDSDGSDDHGSGKSAVVSTANECIAADSSPITLGK